MTAASAPRLLPPVLALLLSLGLSLLGALRPAQAQGQAVAPPAAGTAITLAVSFPPDLPGLGGVAQSVAERLALISEQRLTLTVAPDRVPATEPGVLFDLIRRGEVQAGFGPIALDAPRVPAAALIGALPFGPEPIDFLAWYEGSPVGGPGREVVDVLYEPHGLKPLLCGLLPPSTAGWYGKPIRSAEDLIGLKIAATGLAAETLEQLGALVRTMPPADAAKALAQGEIDGAVFSTPVTDEALGMDLAARHVLLPGWQQPATPLFLRLDLNLWRSLTAPQQALLETVCKAAVVESLGRSEAAQGPALTELAARGIEPIHLPEDVLVTIRDASRDVLRALVRSDPPSQTVLDSLRLTGDQAQPWRELGYPPRDFR